MPELRRESGDTDDRRVLAWRPSTWPFLLGLGILGGGVVSLFATLLALLLLAAGAPAWLAVLVFAAHIPWIVGVWRSAGRPGVSHAASNVARLAILAWVVVLSLL